MRSHLQAVDYVLWRIVKNGPLVPTTIQMALPYLDPEETDEPKLKAAKIATAVEVPVTNIDEVDLRNAAEVVVVRTLPEKLVYGI